MSLAITAPGIENSSDSGVRLEGDFFKGRDSWNLRHPRTQQARGGAWIITFPASDSWAVAIGCGGGGGGGSGYGGCRCNRSCCLQSQKFRPRIHLNP